MRQEIVIMLIALVRSLFSEEHQVQQHIADLVDDDLNAASEAAEALGDLGHPLAVPALLTMLDLTRSEIENAQDGVTLSQLVDLRQDIVRALGKIGDERAVEPLTFVRDYDTDRGIRYEAAEALRRITPL